MRSKNTDEELIFTYTFKFADGQSKEFVTKVNKITLDIIKPPREEYPDWVKMSEFKCSHCPLDENVVVNCPLAENVVELIEQFQDLPSFENTDVEVQAGERFYHKHTSLQSGISSLLGIRMVSSGCPIIGKLKPMLHFHLPFATLDETQVRVLSIYLLSQYVTWTRGKAPDWEMKNLIKIYEDIRTLNMNVSRKIANLEKKDANINSLIILNNFADYVTFTISEKLIEELEVYLHEFLDNKID